MSYKIKFIFEFTNFDAKQPRFKKEIKLPFPPYKGLEIHSRNSTIVNLYPVQKMIYDLDEGIFICYLSWTPVKEMTGSDWQQLFKNLEMEGWVQIG